MRLGSPERPETGAVRDTARTGPLMDSAAATFGREHPGPTGAEIIVVIPALNEEGSVAAVVRSVPTEILGLRTATLVVDDGSGDGTEAQARQAGALVCRIPVNVGQGNAFRLGYRLARHLGARFIATADADGQFDPGELPALVAPLLAGDADLVNGSRRLGRTYGTDPVRNSGVVVFGALVSLLTGTRITDPANGLRAMRAEVTEAVSLVQPQYQTSELLIRAVAQGFRVTEVPATMYLRTSGRSKKGRNLVYGARFARVVLTTWWSERRGLVARRLRRRPGLRRPGA